MRYPASEKLEIIRLVEGSHLPTKRTLDKLGIPRTTFYRWYDRYLTGGPEALEDRSPRPSWVWSRIPDPVREKIKDLAAGQAFSMAEPPESGPPTGIDLSRNWRISDGWKTREAQRYCGEASASRTQRQRRARALERLTGT